MQVIGEFKRIISSKDLVIRSLEMQNINLQNDVSALRFKVKEQREKIDLLLKHNLKISA